MELFIFKPELGFSEISEKEQQQIYKGPLTDVPTLRVITSMDITHSAHFNQEAKSSNILH